MLHLQLVAVSVLVPVVTFVSCEDFCSGCNVQACVDHAACVESSVVRALASAEGGAVHVLCAPDSVCPVHVECGFATVGLLDLDFEDMAVLS